MNAACTVLIVDDEYWVRENLRNLLSAERLPLRLLEPAANGEEALRMMETERPDILITDITMPFVSGNELIRAVRQRFPGMPTIVLSGYSDFAYVREALLNGAIDYLLKPVSRSALVEVLDKALSLLDRGREQELQRMEQQERIRQASSILRDGELSLLIAEEGGDPGAHAALSPLDLEFAVFTLLLVKLTGLLPRGRVEAGASAGWSSGIKDVMTRGAPDARQVAFHNVYARNEFVLLTGVDREGIDRLCRTLPAAVERAAGCRASIAVSRPYYSFTHLRDAYREAHDALMERSAAGENVVRAANSRGLVLRKRITPELEKRLLFALQSRDKAQAREVIFNQIGLGGCDDWLMLEVKQAAEYAAGMIIQHGDTGASPRSTLSLENIAELLGMALDRQDLAEVRSMLDQMLDETFGDSTAPGASDSMRQTVRHVQDYLEENYFDALSLTTLSRMFRVERSYLSKSFKQVTGCNLMLAIARKRIEKAAEYIRGQDMSLSEIGFLVGYEEYAYFNRVFHKIMGESPSEFKARVRGGETR